MADRIALRWTSTDPAVIAALNEHAALIADEVLATDFAQGEADDTYGAPFTDEGLSLTFRSQGVAPAAAGPFLAPAAPTRPSSSTWGLRPQPDHLERPRPRTPDRLKVPRGSRELREQPPTRPQPKNEGRGPPRSWWAPAFGVAYPEQMPQGTARAPETPPPETARQGRSPGIGAPP